MPQRDVQPLRIANSVDHPEQIASQSDMNLHCLLIFPLTGVIVVPLFDVFSSMSQQQKG